MYVQLDACTDKMYTYAELQDKTVRCAVWMQKQGIKSGDVISVCTHNHPDSIVPCLSATYVNAIFNPWNENMDLRKMFQNNHYQMLQFPVILGFVRIIKCLYCIIFY